jgi:hypothetical protein
MVAVNENDTKTYHIHMSSTKPFYHFFFHCFHENDISIYDMLFSYIFNLVDYFYMNINGTQSHKQAKILKKWLLGKKYTSCI